MRINSPEDIINRSAVAFVEAKGTDQYMEKRTILLRTIQEQYSSMLVEQAYPNGINIEIDATSWTEAILSDQITIFYEYFTDRIAVDIDKYDPSKSTYVNYLKSCLSNYGKPIRAKQASEDARGGIQDIFNEYEKKVLRRILKYTETYGISYDGMNNRYLRIIAEEIGFRYELVKKVWMKNEKTHPGPIPIDNGEESDYEDDWENWQAKAFINGVMRESDGGNDSSSAEESESCFFANGTEAYCHSAPSLSYGDSDGGNDEPVSAAKLFSAVDEFYIREISSKEAYRKYFPPCFTSDYFSALQQHVVAKHKLPSVKKAFEQNWSLLEETFKQTQKKYVVNSHYQCIYAGAFLYVLAHQTQYTQVVIAEEFKCATANISKYHKMFINGMRKSVALKNALSVSTCAGM